MGRVEILENGQTFLKVRNDRCFDDLARRLGHQPTHTGKLLHLRWRTTRTGVAHHIDRVDRQFAAMFVHWRCLQLVHHGVGDLVTACGPGVDHLVILFLLRDQAVLILLLKIGNNRLGFGNHFGFFFRNDHVVLAERNTGLERIFEAKRHDGVCEENRVFLTRVTVDLIDNVADFLLGKKAVNGLERHTVALWQRFCKQHTARCGVEAHHALYAIFTRLWHAGDDLGVKRYRTHFNCLMHFGHIGQHHAFAWFAAAIHREIIQTQDHILRRNDDWLTIGWRQDVVGRHHQYACFQLRLKAQWNVDGHLVTIEVGVKCRADQWVKLDRLAFNQDRFERLNAQTVKRRCAVQQHGMLADNLVEDVPNFLALLFDPLLGLLQGH